MVERSTPTHYGRVVARVAPDATKKTLHGLAKEYILPSSTVFTDDYVSYDGLEMHGMAMSIAVSGTARKSTSLATSTLRRLKDSGAW